ncbi:MAG TPA: deoxyribose-phosphate aldolase, partial [Microbacteriaceae bacterium]|nr:deoxyribose-phosphate aldolase [Microbacteriaceae bacterium]
MLGGEPDDVTLRRYLHGLPGVDAVGLEQRSAGLGTRSIKTTSKAWALDRIIQLTDLTTLEGADTPGKVRSLVAKALRPDASDPTCPRV